MDTSRERQFVRVACHASALTSWTLVMIGVPIGVLMLSDDPLSRDSAKEALNFIISQAIWSVIFIAAYVTIIGIPVGMFGFWALGLATVILPLVAIFSVCMNPDRAFRYPCTFRLIPTDPPQLVQKRVV